MSNKQVYESADLDYGNENFRSTERIKSPKTARPTMGRRGKAPQSFNGMHRRRRRKINW
jgi:hypothetical protein